MLREMICRRVEFAPPEVVSYFAPWYFQTISPVSGLSASVVFADGMYISPFAQQSGVVCTGPEYCGTEYPWSHATLSWLTLLLLICVSCEYAVFPASQPKYIQSFAQA